MKLYVTVEEFIYAKKIENQTQRTLRGYKNALNLFANWLQKEWTIDELEKVRVVHLKQYVAYHLKMGHKETYRHMWTRKKRWMQSRKPLIIGRNMQTQNLKMPQSTCCFRLECLC